MPAIIIRQSVHEATSYALSVGQADFFTWGRVYSKQNSAMMMTDISHARQGISNTKINIYWPIFLDRYGT